MNFRILAIITSIITLILGIGYLFFGSVVVGRWGIEPTNNLLLLGRRMGSLYLGLSIMYFMARSSPLSATRTAIISGTAFSLSMLVVLGIYELSSGHVGQGILVSIVVEALLAISYIQVLFKERKSAFKSEDYNKKHAHS